MIGLKPNGFADSMLEKLMREELESLHTRTLNSPLIGELKRVLKSTNIDLEVAALSRK